MDVIICDRDVVIACAGVSKREYLDKHLSAEVEHLMDGRSIFVHREGDERMMPLNEQLSHYVSCAMPIISVPSPTSFPNGFLFSSVTLCL